MAVRHGDDQIASVLNRLGYSTGKGNRWNQNRVATARKNHSIAGQRRALPDPERVSLNEAARLCRESPFARTAGGSRFTKPRTNGSPCALGNTSLRSRHRAGSQYPRAPPSTGKLLLRGGRTD